MKIQEKAMLVKLSISLWSGRKLDRKITAEVNAEHGAANDAGRYNKLLISSGEIKKIEKIRNKIYMYHTEQTLPWTDGERLLPSVNFFEYRNEIDKLKNEFFTAVNEFLTNYNMLVDDAKVRLNGMFNINDYPTASHIQKKFDVSIEILPIPDSADFRVDLNNENVVEIQNQINETVKDRIKETVNDIYSRLQTAVNHTAETLSDNDKIFRNSLIDNIKDLILLLPKLNITGDAELDIILNDCKQLLVDPELLRDNSLIRQDTAQTAKEISEKITNKINSFFA